MSKLLWDNSVSTFRLTLQQLSQDALLARNDGKLQQAPTLMCIWHLCQLLPQYLLMMSDREETRDCLYKEETAVHGAEFSRFATFFSPINHTSMTQYDSCYKKIPLTSYDDRNISPYSGQLSRK